MGDGGVVGGLYNGGRGCIMVIGMRGARKMCLNLPSV